MKDKRSTSLLLPALHSTANITLNSNTTSLYYPSYFVAASLLTPDLQPAFELTNFQSIQSLPSFLGPVFQAQYRYFLKTWKLRAQENLLAKANLVTVRYSLMGILLDERLGTESWPLNKQITCLFRIDLWPQASSAGGITEKKLHFPKIHDTSKAIDDFKQCILSYLIVHNQHLYICGKITSKRTSDLLENNVRQPHGLGVSG